MAWIKTIPFTQADETLLKALLDQHKLYPKEYARQPDDDGSHSDRARNHPPAQQPALHGGPLPHSRGSGKVTAAAGLASLGTGCCAR